MCSPTKILLLMYLRQRPLAQHCNFHKIAQLYDTPEHLLVVAITTAFFALCRGQGLLRQGKAHLSAPVPHTAVVNVRTRCSKKGTGPLVIGASAIIRNQHERQHTRAAIQRDKNAASPECVNNQPSKATQPTEQRRQQRSSDDEAPVDLRKNVNVTMAWTQRRRD